MAKRSGLGNIGGRFRIVLILLAGLSLASYVIQEYFIIAQHSSATEINVAGRQRMLTQRISLLASRLEPANAADLEQAEALRSKLSRAVNQFETAHKALIEGNTIVGTRPPQSDMLKAMYFGPELFVDRDVKAFLVLVRPLLWPDLSAEDLRAHKRAFFSFDSDQLLTDLNKIVARYEYENKSRFENLSIYQTLSFVAILITILVSWVMVFQPLIRQLNKYIGTIFQQSFDLRGSEDRFRSITDSSVLAMIIAVDQDGSVISWNPAAERFFGYSQKEIIGQPAKELVPLRHRDIFEEKFKDVVKGEAPQFLGQSIEIVGLTKNGSEFPIEISLGTWTQGGKKYFGAIVHDITPRVEAEKALKASAHRLERAQKIAGIVHWEWDTQTDEIITDEEGVKLLGSDPSLGRPTPRWFFSRVFEPDKVKFRETIIHGLRTGDTIQMEFRFIRDMNASELCWLHMDCGFEKSKDGKVIKMVGAARDITADKRLENTLIAAKEEAELANRAKTTFLANMSHELRTPLNAIIGFSDIIRNELLGAVGNENYRNYASDIYKSGNHLLSILSDILDISKIEAGKVDFSDEPVALEEVIESCQIILDQRLKEGKLTLEIDIPKDFPRVKGDGLRLKQIALNILTNSVKFTPPGGVIRFNAKISKTGEASLTFSDTGQGIAAEDLALVMRPFFQSGDMHNSPQEGNGLGLYITQVLVELHGGYLDLYSTVGEGTTVEVTLPAERVLDTTTMILGHES